MRYDMQGHVMIGMVLPACMLISLVLAVFSSLSKIEAIYVSEDGQVTEYLRQDTIIRMHLGPENHEQGWEQKRIIPGLSEFRKIAVFEVRNGYKEKKRTTTRYGWRLEKPSS